LAAGCCALEANGHAAALHGSRNRPKRIGLIRALMKDACPTGVYEDFMTGFVIDDETVWGRPAGVAVTRDGVSRAAVRALGKFHGPMQSDLAASISSKLLVGARPVARQ
jgi:hypothetical protein